MPNETSLVHRRHMVFFLGRRSRPPGSGGAFRRFASVAGACLAGALGREAWALDPNLRISQYHQRVWRTEDGLPQNSVAALARAPDGYLWVGTESGLARFDGVRFTVFDSSNTEALITNKVVSLFLDRDGALWMANLGGGIVRLLDGEFRLYSPTAGLASYGVFAVHGDPRRTIWAATSSGVSAFERGAFTTYGPAQGLAHSYVTSVFADSRTGDVWAGTRGGLTRFRGGQVTSYTRRDGLPGDSVLTVFVDRGGSLWLGMEDEGLVRFAGGKFERFTVRDGLPGNTVLALREDRHGALWIGTTAGLCRRTRHGFESYTLADGLPANAVLALLEDPEGSLWVGTKGGGLVQLRDGDFTTYTSKEGLVDSFTRAVAETPDGSIWVATNGGLSRFQGGRLTSYAVHRDLPEGAVLALCPGRDGSLWAGTSRGLLRYQRGSFSVVEGVSGEVRAVYEHDGDLWLSLDSYPHRLRNGGLTPLTRSDATTFTVTCFAGRPGGPLWMGSYEGLFSLSAGALQVHPIYTPKEGESRGIVNAILEEADGSLWLATRDRGLARFVDGRVRLYSKEQGLPVNEIHQLVQDDRGGLWLGTGRGILRVSRNELEEIDAGRRNRLSVLRYGPPDGLKSEECQDLGSPLAWKARDGRLWFTTTRGVSVTLARGEPRGPLPVVVEQAIANGKPVGPSLDVAPGGGALEVHYTSLSLLDPRQARFRYRLEGYDHGWIEAGPLRTAYYTKLPPGRYRFRVVASNEGGAWNEAGASLSLHFRPHFFETWWFRGLCVLGVVLLGLGLHRLRTRGLVRLVDERTKELRTYRDHLEEQVAERTAELRNAEKKYRDIFEHAAEGIFQTSPSGRFLIANPALARMYGYESPEDLMDATSDIATERYVEPDRRQDFVRALQERGSVQDFTFQAYRRDGRRIWVKLSARAVRDSSGAIVYYEGTAEDVTERKRAEELQDSLRRSERMSALGMLLAGVAHEVRNPLFGISANLDAIEALAGDRRSAFDPLVAAMRSAVGRLATLMQGLLNYGKPLDSLRASEPIERVVGEAVESCMGLAARTGVKLVNSLGPDLPPVSMDRKRLVQVFENLLQNAIQHSPPGGVVSVAGKRDCSGREAWVVVSVCDSGPGFPLEDLSRVFEPFFSRRQGGTGLGLAIVQRIVEEHGGTISAANRPEGGASMVVRLPPSSAEESPEGPESPEPL